MGFAKNEKKCPSASACAQLKAAYYECFNRWYTDKFLKGEWDKQGCVSEWQNYRACLSDNLNDKHLARFLQPEQILSPEFGGKSSSTS